jgi:hypothetical protein
MSNHVFRAIGPGRRNAKVKSQDVCDLLFRVILQKLIRNRPDHLVAFRTPSERRLRLSDRQSEGNSKERSAGTVLCTIGVRLLGHVFPFWMLNDRTLK